LEDVFPGESKSEQNANGASPGAGKEDFSPPAMKLPAARARQMVLSYVSRFLTLNTIQAVRNPATGRTTSKWVRAVLSSNEEAVQDVKLMNKSTFTKSDVSTATKALETLRLPVK
jgi:hypothetical protein